MTAIYLKTEEEIEGFERAGLAAREILKKLLEIARAGDCTPLDLDAIAREETQKLGAVPAFLGYRGFPAAICVSRGNVMVHGIPNDIPFEKGEMVSIDFGLDIDGFIGDTADTVVVQGAANKQIISCRGALLYSRKLAKEGNKLSDISAKINHIAQKFGFLTPDEYGGHGIDRHNMHATPFIPNKPDFENDFTLRAGMILAIEPMFIDAPSNKVKIATDGWAVMAGGLTAHCEHTILVGDYEGIPLT